MRGKARVIEDSSSVEDDMSESEEEQSPERNGAFSKCKPKHRRNNNNNPESEEEEVIPRHMPRPLSVFIERDSNESDSPVQDKEESEQEQEEVNGGGEVLSYFDDDNELIDFIDTYKDKRGRIIWQCLLSNDKISHVTQVALMENKDARKRLLEEGLVVENEEKHSRHKPPEKKKREVKRKKKEKEKRQQRSKIEAKRVEDRIKQLERDSILKDLEKVKSLDILSKEKMDLRVEQKLRERELNTLKQDKVNADDFSEVGKLDQHVPLEIIDFVGQPPFKGDTSNLMVLVRWKHDEKGNYQPTDSQVLYHALRQHEKYKRLVIDLFVKKTQLTRY